MELKQREHAGIAIVPARLAIKRERKDAWCARRGITCRNGIPRRSAKKEGVRVGPIRRMRRRFAISAGRIVRSALMRVIVPSVLRDIIWMAMSVWINVRVGSTEWGQSV